MIRALFFATVEPHVASAAGVIAAARIGGPQMLISPAYAQAAGGGAGFDIMSLLPLVLIFVVFYFLLIRRKRPRSIARCCPRLSQGQNRHQWRPDGHGLKSRG